jgi:SAM-dependent methyltransferase
MAEQVMVYSPKAPVLEVGAMNINGSVRELFPQPYTGLDMREGIGVDIVADIEIAPFRDAFNTVVSTETLEHVRRPWVAMRAIERAMKKNALVFFAVPFMFELHGYPSDYWRITDEGMRVLFEESGLHCLEAVTRDTHTYAIARKL